MNYEYTLSIIKPDATQRNIIGDIISYLEGVGLKIVGQKMMILTKAQAEEFYTEHKEKPFYQGLIESITSGPIVVQVLKGENAILKNREIMGTTNPENANIGTIRKDFGLSLDANSVHGSDSKESAEREISLFFDKLELVE